MVDKNQKEMELWKESIYAKYVREPLYKMDVKLNSIKESVDCIKDVIAPYEHKDLSKNVNKLQELIDQIFKDFN